MPSLATIMRHEAQLRQASRQISQAKSIIDSSSKACDAAAMALLASWEGAAADAFRAEQLNFKNWITKMLEVIQEVITFVDKANSAYSNVDDIVKNLIGKK